jgi:hypothetical protein
MVRNLYLVLVVGIRSVALYVILSGLFSWIARLIVTRGSGLGIPILAMLLPIFGGLLLWVLAKPFATLLTKDLE